ncbi:MAG: translation initiation factor IF-2 [Candidatus Omnitrophota bacterium]
MSIRVHALAKELGLTSKDFIEKLHKLKVDVKGHMSAIDEETAEIVRHEIAGQAKPKAKAKGKPSKEKVVKKAAKEKPAKAVPAKEMPSKEKPHKEKPLKDEPVEEEKEEVIVEEREEVIVEEERVSLVEEEPAAPPEKKLEPLEVDLPVTVKDFSAKLSKKPSELISNLIAKGIFASINQNLTEEVVNDIAAECGYRIVKPPDAHDALLQELKIKDKGGKKVLRPPVVTFMGHVDHGKTSLLDYIRKTTVAKKEKGGITQHIGAYQVKLERGAVTFLDTPGHEAFTAMRARGANATDVVVLVVAADDGIMPQTREAIDHAQAAGVPIVVAINKCDLPSANPERVKKQLAQINLMSEDWGGSTITVPVSAKTGEGVEELLEMLLLEAELLELKAIPELHARGVVIEGKLSPGRGVVSTLLVKNGTLRVGDMILSGLHYGRIKAMTSDSGEKIDEALPSMPVEILGLSGVPQSGDEFFEVRDEKKARTLSLLKQQESKERANRARSSRISLEQLHEKIMKEHLKELRIILKGDVVGSTEALQRSLENLSTEEVSLKVIHSAVGNITESDIMLAIASNALVMGFHVKMEPKAQITSEEENVDSRLYDIIYEAIADIKAAMEGLLEPITKEVFQGKAEVRQVFKVTKAGTIAGCYVLKGRITRNAKAKLVRNKKVIYEGKISSLKHFKDDIKEARENFECGIGLQNHNEIRSGDIIDVFIEEKTTRRL